MKKFIVFIVIGYILYLITGISLLLHGNFIAIIALSTASIIFIILAILELKKLNHEN